MRIRAILGSVLSASAILLVGWEVGATAHVIPAAVSVSQAALAAPHDAGSSIPAPQAGPKPAAPSGTPPASASAPSAAKQTFVGASTSTPYGDVQVQVTISGTSITDVSAVHLTDADGRSVQISNRAAPVLRSEVLSAQSSKVHMVSGATYTSDAYLTSLQSALDQAGL